MRKYRDEIIKVVDVVICDMCGQEDTDPMEIQEYLAIDFVGGFQSIFGDMEEYTGDICQRCLKVTLGSYLTKVEKTKVEKHHDKHVAYTVEERYFE